MWGSGYILTEVSRSEVAYNGALFSVYMQNCTGRSPAPNALFPPKESTDTSTVPMCRTMIDSVRKLLKIV